MNKDAFDSSHMATDPPATYAELPATAKEAPAYEMPAHSVGDKK
jgi:hypothetical protein